MFFAVHKHFSWLRGDLRENQEDLAESSESASEHSANPGLNEAAVGGVTRDSSIQAGVAAMRILRGLADGARWYCTV